MSKSNKKNKNFVPLDASLERKAKTRDERSVAESLPLILFSFKDFQFNQQIPPGQSYRQWQENEMLAYMLEKFGSTCNLNIVEAIQQKLLKIYGNFPNNSEFRNPFPDEKLEWGVIMKISGQKGRVAGHLMNNVFYIVFLDEEHKFYPTEKRDT